MALYGSLIREASTSTGTGNFAIAIVNGHRRLSDEFSTGGSDTLYYFISHQTAAEWEFGTGSISDANTLVRDTVISSSNSDAKVNFAAGTKDIMNAIPAEYVPRVPSDFATDNRLLRSDGTERDIQASGITIDDSDNVSGAGISLGNNTVTGTTAQFNTALSDGSFATLAGTETLTNKTLTSPTINTPALGADSVDAITEIAAALRSGSDTTLVTGTAGTNGDLSVWNADGDLVDGPTPPSGAIVGTTDTQTITNKTVDLTDNTVQGTAAEFDTAVTDDNFVYQSDTASTTASGIVELATNAETQTGTDTARATTPAGVKAAIDDIEHEIIISISDETTALTTGTAKVTFDMPYAMTVTDIKASVATAPTGASVIIDVNDEGTSIMTTNKLEIEASETSTETAATAPTVTDTALAEDATITIDIDQVGSTVAGAGAKVYLIGTKT